MLNFDLGLVLDLVTIAVAVGAAWILMRSKLCQQTSKELAQLAEARKEQVDHLEQKVDDQKQEIVDLRADVNMLKGKLEGVYAIKAEQIADLVVEKLNGGKQ